MPLCARATPGFSGAAFNKRHLRAVTGRARTSRTRPPAAPSLRSAAPVSRFAASAKRHAFGCVHCPAASAPLALLRVRGASGQKNPPRPRGHLRLPIPGLVLAPGQSPVMVACASPRSGEGFCGASPSARAAVQGVRRWRGEKRCQRRVFQGLRRSRDSASKSEQYRGDEGASPSETPEHRKTRIARARSARVSTGD